MPECHAVAGKHSSESLKEKGDTKCGAFEFSIKNSSPQVTIICMTHLMNENLFIYISIFELIMMIQCIIIPKRHGGAVVRMQNDSFDPDPDPDWLKFDLAFHLSKVGKMGT